MIERILLISNYAKQNTRREEERTGMLLFIRHDDYSRQ